MNQKHGDQALAELVTVLFWVALEDKWTERNFSPEWSLELERESNFDKMAITGGLL
jgi:hypothetical protein